jgi:hypothetical protein
MLHKKQNRHSALGWLLLLAALSFSAVAAFLFWRGKPQPQATGPLDGSLTVLVRPPDRTMEPVSVDAPGALPVQSNGAMCLEVQLQQPAFAYLVWIDSAGRVLPLYPWNNESLEITDADQPPPQRRLSTRIFSPLLGRNWTFGKQAGTETVLLLARRTPLPSDVQLGKLLAASPPPQILAEPHRATAASIRGPGIPGSPNVTAGMPASDLPLARFIEPLGDHFELIRAVQFAHAAESPAPPASTQPLNPEP